MTQPVRNPSWSLNALRTKVAAPPVSGRAVVPSAYERATSRKSTPTPSRIHGVKPSASRATTPRAKKSDEAISPYATAAREGVSRTRCRPGSFLATQPGSDEDPQETRRHEQPAEEEAEPAADARGHRPHDERHSERDHHEGEHAPEHVLR